MENKYDSLSDGVFNFVRSNFKKSYMEKYSRFAIVYDFGSLDFFPLVMGGLSKSIEKKYRSLISSPADFQLLWNPEEFPYYATTELQLRVPIDVEDLVQKNIEDNDPGYEKAIRNAINSACSRLNVAYDYCPFFFSTDPELADLKDNIASIGNIPDSFKAELPTWM